MHKPGQYYILVAVETDSTLYHGENAVRPGTLGRSDAEQMLAHVAADLGSMIHGISQCSLVSVGALFDQTQLLRPGFPAFSALNELLTARHSDADHGAETPRLVSLGAENGSLPAGPLMPDPKIPIGPLQLLPILVRGPIERVAALGEDMEQRFMETGQLSAHSAGWLESAFGVSVQHARFMTMADLMAMFRIQLEHFGFLPLWRLIDAALLTAVDEDARQYITDAGLSLGWSSDRVQINFETFNYWSSVGGGKQLAAHGQILATGYANWTRELRRYANTLSAHDIPTEIRMPPSATDSTGCERFRLLDSYCVETVRAPGKSSWARVTEHSFSDLGTVAVTVAAATGLEHYFPLSAEGLNDIHRDIRRGLGDGGERPMVAFPGCILYDEKSRYLLPDKA